MMKTGAIKTVLALLLPAVAFAVGPYLAGTWVLDLNKSPAPKAYPGMPGPAREDEVKLEVIQTEGELQVIRKAGNRNIELKYLLDGTENINPSTDRYPGQVRSRVRWSGDKLIIEGTQLVNTPYQEFKIGVTEEWTLSRNGRTLTVVTTWATPQGGRTTVAVYSRR